MNAVSTFAIKEIVSLYYIDDETPSYTGYYKTAYLICLRTTPRSTGAHTS